MVESRPYVPERGDIVYVGLDPTRGHEQTGRRPVLVVSNRLYNERSSLIIACPLTSRRKKFVFEVPVTFKGRAGSVLVDQIRALDRMARPIEHAGRLAEKELAHVLGLLDALLFQ
ncbi:MAG TPA: type II toxin-antitoxin system PemK/MazF family toxin [Candidatus Dormibacteraeota bacterium]|nr:type II toxin-antitoxin system PemK/MazF family toxin [Candidatus Dormibacteraeota bacterium]